MALPLEETSAAAHTAASTAATNTLVADPEGSRDEAFTPRRGAASDVSPSQGVAAAAVALLLVVAVPIMFVDWTRSASTPLNTALALMLLAFSAWRLTEAIALGRTGLLRSVFYVFVYVFLAMPALAESISGSYPLDGLTYEPATVTSGLVHLVLGVAAYELGWAYHRSRRRAADKRARVPRFTFSSTRCVLVGGVGLAMTVYQVAQVGLTAFFTSRSETTVALTGADENQPFYMSENKTGGLVTATLSQYPVFVALFVILYARRHHLWPARGLVQDVLWRVFIVLLIGANVVMNNPMGNGRWWFCLVGVAFVSIYIPFDRRGGERLYIGAAIVLLFFTFASLDLYRTDTSTLNVSGPSRTFIENGTYAMFQEELNGVRYVAGAGHTEGRQLLGAVLGFVPRGVWASKPIPTGQVVDPQYVRSTTAWTEAQVDFGLVGIVAFFLAYGVLSRALTRRSAGVPPGVLHAVLPVLGAFQIFLLRGSLQPAVGSLYQLGVVLLCVVTIHPSYRRLTERRRVTSSEPPSDSSAPGSENLVNPEVATLRDG